MAASHQVRFARPQPTRIAAVHSVDVLEQFEQFRHVLLASTVDNVHVRCHQRRSLKHGRHPADYDVFDFAC